MPCQISWELYELSCFLLNQYSGFSYVWYMMYVWNQNVFSYVAMHLFSRDYNQNTPLEVCTWFTHCWVLLWFVSVNCIHTLHWPLGDDELILKCYIWPHFMNSYLEYILCNYCWDKSTLVQVLPWGNKSTSDPISTKTMALLSHNLLIICHYIHYATNYAII